MTDDVFLPDPPGTQDSREMAVLRKQTIRFVKENATVVQIQRGTGMVPDGAGGWTPAPGSTPIDPQEFRLIIQNTSGYTATRNIDGETISPAFVMIGMYDANVQEGDTFVLDGNGYRVSFVRDDKRYETWSEVEYLG